MQLLEFSNNEYCPFGQSIHIAFDVMLPLAFIRCPGLHVVCGIQCLEFSDDENVPVGHCSHTLSDATVVLMLTFSPGLHVV